MPAHRKKPAPKSDPPRSLSHHDFIHVFIKIQRLDGFDAGGMDWMQGAPQVGSFIKRKCYPCRRSLLRKAVPPFVGPGGQGTRRFFRSLQHRGELPMFDSRRSSAKPTSRSNVRVQRRVPNVRHLLPYNEISYGTQSAHVLRFMLCDFLARLVQSHLRRGTHMTGGVRPVRY